VSCEHRLGMLFRKRSPCVSFMCELVTILAGLGISVLGETPKNILCSFFCLCKVNGACFRFSSEKTGFIYVSIAAVSN